MNLLIIETFKQTMISNHVTFPITLKNDYEKKPYVTG